MQELLSVTVRTGTRTLKSGALLTGATTIVMACVVDSGCSRQASGSVALTDAFDARNPSSHRVTLKTASPK